LLKKQATLTRKPTLLNLPFIKSSLAQAFGDPDDSIVRIGLPLTDVLSPPENNKG
jgi:hypothetical protein